MSGPAVTLRFQYFEIIDRDHTLTRVEVFEGGQTRYAFTNLPAAWESCPRLEVYGNQCEDFQLPGIEMALEMLRSNSAYREVEPGLCCKGLL